MLYMSIVHSIKHTEVVHNPSHQWCGNEFYYVGGSGITSTKLRKQFNYSAVSLVSDVAVTFGIGGHSSMKVGNCKTRWSWHGTKTSMKVIQFQIQGLLSPSNEEGKCVQASKNWTSSRRGRMSSEYYETQYC